LVQLTSDASGNDLTALTARLERLEKAIASGTAASPAAPASRPAAVDPATGRAAIGGRVPRDQPAAAPTPSAVAPAGPRIPSSPAPVPVLEPAAAAATQPSTQVRAEPARPPESARPAEPAPVAAPAPTAVAAPVVAPVAAQPGDAANVAGRVAAAWQAEILPTMKPMARALFSAGHFVGERNGALTFGLPNDTHRTRCEQHRVEVQAAIAAFTGVDVTVALVVEAGKGAGDGHDDHLAPVVPLRSGQWGSSTASVAAPADEDEDIDVDDLVDAPPGSVKTVEDRLSDAFPGSVFVDDRN
ncbi:MAG: hypothetical protein ABIR32_11270, partial [Ilumatobacteraceae bacterium]